MMYMHKDPSYKQAFHFAWKITHKHKVLWLFGIFAAVLGHLGFSELISKLGFFATPLQSSLPLGGDIIQLFSVFGVQTIGSSVAGLGNIIWLILAIYGILILALFALGIVSQGALIHSAAHGTKHNQLPTVPVSWHAGFVHTVPLGILFICKLVILFIGSVLLAAVAVWYANTASILVFLIAVLTFLGVIGLSVITTFIVMYASGYVVIEEYKLGKAIVAAWKLFKNHVLVTVEVGLLLMVLDVILFALLILILFALVVPSTFIWFVIAGAVGSTGLFSFGLISTSVLFTLIIIVLGGWLVAFSTSAWMYLFMHMHHVGIESRLARLFKQ